MKTEDVEIFIKAMITAHEMLDGNVSKYYCAITNMR